MLGVTDQQSRRSPVDGYLTLAYREGGAPREEGPQKYEPSPLPKQAKIISKLHLIPPFPRHFTLAMTLIAYK